MQAEFPVTAPSLLPCLVLFGSILKFNISAPLAGSIHSETESHLSMVASVCGVSTASGKSTNKFLEIF